MDRSLRPPLVIYSFGYRGCSLFALLAALTSAMFLEVWGWIRSGWWAPFGLAVLGLGLLFYRRGIVIDPENRRVTLILRGFVPVTSRATVPMDRVSVRLQRVVADPDRFEVWLDRTDGPSFRVELNSAENPREAAERLAADLGKPLVVRDA